MAESTEVPSPAVPDPREFRSLLKLAQARGWRVPDPDSDRHGPAAWMRYWEDLRDADGWRPIPPHTPGVAPIEDVADRAIRINRNRAIWKGYLT